jgi:hypothetical protein
MKRSGQFFATPEQPLSCRMHLSFLTLPTGQVLPKQSGRNLDATHITLIARKT